METQQPVLVVVWKERDKHLSTSNKVSRTLVTDSLLGWETIAVGGQAFIETTKQGMTSTSSSEVHPKYKIMMILKQHSIDHPYLVR